MEINLGGFIDEIAALINDCVLPVKITLPVLRHLRQIDLPSLFFAFASIKNARKLKAYGAAFMHELKDYFRRMVTIQKKD